MVLKMDRITIGHFRKYFFSASNEDGETIKEVVLMDASKPGPSIIASQANINHSCVYTHYFPFFVLCVFVFEINKCK